MKNEKIFETLKKYVNGEIDAAAANDILTKENAGFVLDETRQTMTKAEAEKFGWLDTGTGTRDKVEVNPETMELVNADCSGMFALCEYMGVTYKVDGKKLVAEK